MIRIARLTSCQLPPPVLTCCFTCALLIFYNREVTLPERCRVV